MADPAQKIDLQQPSSPSSSGSSGGALDIQWIMARAKMILSDPKGVWPTLKSESLDLASLYKKYLIPLALGGALCGFLGMWLIGVSVLGVTVRAHFFSGLMSSLINCALGLGMFFLAGYIFQAIAPKFGGSTTIENTVKLIGFSSTAALLGQYLSIIPMLALIGSLFGIYSVYTLFQGIPEMTGVPKEKRAPFFLVCFLATAVSTFIIFMVVGAISPWSMSSATPGFNIETQNGTFDQQKFEQGLKELQKLVPNAPQGN